MMNEFCIQIDINSINFKRRKNFFNIFSLFTKSSNFYYAMKIEKLILGTLNNSNETRQDAEYTLEQIRDLNFPYFLNKLLKLLMKTENPNCVYISLNLILRESEKNSLFDNSILSDFFSNFQTVLTSLFLSNKINQPISHLISKILAKISFRISSANIEFFLLSSYEQFPQLRFLFLNTLGIIFLRQPTNSPFETFVSIFSNQPTTPEEFNSILFLLFTLIKHFPKNSQNIAEILISYLQAVPNESIPSILNTISLFVKPFRQFIQGFCYPPIFEFIIRCISFQDNFLIQSRAVECLGNLCKSFDKDPEIMNQILSILTQIIEENDSDIQVICTESICNLSNSHLFLSSFNKIQQSQNYQFSYLQVLSLLDNQCVTQNFQMLENTVTYFEKIHFILNHINQTDPNKIFRIRLAGYGAIQNLCQILGPKFQEDNFQSLFAFLSTTLYNETNIQLIISILNSLSALLDRVELNELSEEFNTFFSFLINLFFHSQNNLIMLSVIDVIQSITKCLSALFLHFYSSIITLMNQVILSPENSSLFVPILSLADVCISAIDKFETEVDKNQLIGLFQLAFQMRSQVESEMEFELISHAINTFIRFFGSDISLTLQNQIVPAFLQQSLLDVEITHLPENHGIETIPGFRILSPLDFGKESTIRIISYALDAIRISISILKNDYIPFLEPTLASISKWISFPFYIQELKEASWKTLDLIDLTFPTFSTNCVFALFLLNTPNDKDLVYEIVLNSLKIGVDKHNFDLNYIPKVLEAISSTIIQTMTVEEEEDQIGIDDYFEYETKILTFCLKHFSEISCSFYQTVFVPKLSELLSYSFLLGFAIKVTTQYILASQDLSFFEGFGSILIQYLSDIEQVPSLASVKAIGKLFGVPNTHPNYLQFSNEVIFSFYEKLIDLLKNGDSFENDLKMIHNESIVVFTKILMYHFDAIGQTLNDSMNLWIGLLPELFDHSHSAIAFDFLAYLLKEKTQNTLEIIGPQTIIKTLLDCLDKEKAVSAINKSLFIAFIKQYIATNVILLTNISEDLTSNEYDQLQLIMKE